MVRRSRKQKKQKSSSSSWSPESSDSSTDLHYSANLPKKKAKKDILANPIKGYLSEDDTYPESSSMRTRRKRKCQSKKEQHVIDEPSSSENNQSSDVLSEEKFKWGRRKRAKRGGTRNSRKGNGQRRRTTILSWLIDCKVIQENAEVFVMEEGEPKTKQGKIRKEGILCSCCYNVFTVADFYSHAGGNNNNNIPSAVPRAGSGEGRVYADLTPTFKKAEKLFPVDPQLSTHAHAGGTSSKPYEKIFIAETCSSLLSCMIQAWDLPEERNYRRFNLIENKEDASDSSDDACMICADGGDLICCDKCSTTYHYAKCLGLEEVPKGSWYCSFCVCKFCGDPANENDYLLKCSQCEKKYHWECHLARVKISIDINNPPQGTFCDNSCNEVYDNLERSIVGVEHELEESYKWTVLKNTDDGSRINIEDDYQRTVCHSKLAVARRLMEDCFEQITDRHTRIDVIKSVVYNCGSNFNRVNFRGFYTIILEKNEEIISAASIRIHGTKLAEMPFIATNKEYRRKGMCRELMVTIESVLHYLKVEKLVIPSVSERIGAWVGNYSFRKVKSPLPEEMKLHNTLMFHDSARLQKDLVSSSLARTCRANSRAKETQSSPTKSGKARPFDLNVEASPEDKDC